MRRFLMIATLCVFGGCDDGTTRPIERTFVSGGYTVDTVEHRGHEFIVYDGNGSGCIIHSPNCYCQQKAERR